MKKKASRKIENLWIIDHKTSFIYLVSDYNQIKSIWGRLKTEYQTP